MWRKRVSSAMATAAKRKSSENVATSGPVAKNLKKAVAPWSMGLKTSMEDPKLRVHADDKCVIIKDKYPKVNKQTETPATTTCYTKYRLLLVLMLHRSLTLLLLQCHDGGTCFSKCFSKCLLYTI